VFHPPSPLARASLVIAAVLAASVAPASSGRGKSKAALRFAAEMARIGNWREAHFRWDLLLRSDPDNPRLLSNLAVAAEALGRRDAARDHYARASSLAPDDVRIEANRLAFERFCRLAGGAEDAAPREPAAPARDSKAAGTGRPLKVTVGLPLPPRLDPGESRTLLVASFLTPESALLDINRELTRFLRGKLKNTRLEVLSVVPPPAVPEQRLEDLVANGEFWKHLGREHGADLILSGAVGYARRDVSGFQEVDRISEATGQKLRGTEFVEQEQFSYELDLIVLDGASGALRFRDRLQRAATYRGAQNDPLTAFFQLNEALAPDLLAIVEPRIREEPRIVFRN